MDALEKKIGYTFNDRSLLERALTHSSYSNENRGNALDSNQRLEFLGDSVLGLAAAIHLYHQNPHLQEGDLTRTRAELVCERSLAAAAGVIGLGEHLRLGRGEETSGGRSRPSILADAMESVIGAVYLDGGEDAAHALVARFILTEKPKKLSDYKTELQEIIQRERDNTLSYRLVSESGPDHMKVFSVEVLHNGSVIGGGEGGSKKEAEQNAAKAALGRV